MARTVNFLTRDRGRRRLGGTGGPAEGDGRRVGDALPPWPLALVLIGAAVAVFASLVLPLAAYDPADHLSVLVFVAAFALTEIAVGHVTVRGQVETVTLREIPFVIGLYFLSPLELILALVGGSGLAMVADRALPVRKVLVGAAIVGLGGSLAVVAARAMMPVEPQSLFAWWSASFLASATFVAFVAGASSVVRRAVHGPPRQVRIDLVLGLAQAFASTSVALVAVVLLRASADDLWLLVGPAAVALLAYRAITIQRDRQARLELLHEWSQLLQHPVLDEATLGRLLEHTCSMLRAGVTEVVFSGSDGRPARRIVALDGSPVRTEPAIGVPVPVPTAAAAPRGWSRRLFETIRPTPLPGDGRFVAPLVGGGDLVGWLIVGERRGRPADLKPDDRRTIEALSSRIGLVMENSALVARLAVSLADVTKLAAIVQSSEDAIVAVSVDGVVTAWNGAAERLFGSSTEEMVGRLVADVVPEPVRLGVSEPYAAVLGGSTARTITTDWARHDGTTIPVSIALSSIRGPSHEVTGVAAIIRDESEQARADEAVRISAEQLRAIIGGSPIGMGVVGDDLRWRQANPALCVVLGTTMGDVIGRSVMEGIHPDDLGTVADLEGQIFHDDAVRSVERGYVSADGTTRWASVTARRLRSPTTESAHAVVTIEDITKRRRAEEEARTTEERFRRGVLTMSTIEDPGMVLRAVLESAREAVDATYAAVVSYTADGVEITRFEYDGFRVDRLAEDIGRAASAVGILAIAPLAGRPIRLTDVRTHPAFEGFPPGHPTLTSLLAVPIPVESEARATLYLANKANDGAFTEADEAIAVALATHAGVCLENARITARARVLVRDLDQANLELMKANDAKSRFMASLAHELRTPLHAIIVAGELVRDSPVAPLSAGQIRDLGGTVQSSGRLMVRLIDDLVDLARIESGRLELRPTLFRLEQVLADIRPELSRLATARGISLDMPEATALRLFADPVRLQQILINLVGNAIKFTEPGGRIWVEANSTRTMAVIAVHDTGIGIAPDDLERAFSPFEQVSRTATTGAGLGLAIARSLAELHDGELVAASTPGAGSSFVLRLPRRVSPSTDQPTESSPEALIGVVGGGRPVLVVEDDSAAMRLVAMILRMADYQVWPTTSLAEARARLAADVPALVLLDVRLGDGDGLTLVQEIRASPRLRDTPVVVLSADTTPEDRRRATVAGCDDFLAKPASPGVIIASIHRLAGSRGGAGDDGHEGPSIR